MCLLKVAKSNKHIRIIIFVMPKKKLSTKIKRCPTDLNDKKLTVISPLIPSAMPAGRTRSVVFRKLSNASKTS